MRITLRLFASLRKHLPPGSPRTHCELELADGATLHDVLRTLSIPREMAQMVLVNGEQDDDRHFGRVLNDGDVVSIFPPVAGGA